MGFEMAHSSQGSCRLLTVFVKRKLELTPRTLSTDASRSLSVEKDLIKQD